MLFKTLLAECAFCTQWMPDELHAKCSNNNLMQFLRCLQCSCITTSKYRRALTHSKDDSWQSIKMFNVEKNWLTWSEIFFLNDIGMNRDASSEETKMCLNIMRDFYLRWWDGLVLKWWIISDCKLRLDRSIEVGGEPFCGIFVEAFSFNFHFQFREKCRTTL